MKITGSCSGAVTALCFATGAVLSMPAAAQSSGESGKWQYTATIYGYMSGIKGKVNLPGDHGSTDIDFPFHDILSSLKMAFMGALDAHNGRWGIFNDVLYMDVGGSQTQQRDFSVGGIGIPATATTNASLDLKSWV